MGDSGNSDFFLAAVVILFLVIAGVFIVAMFNKDLFDVIKNKNVRETSSSLGVNVSNGTLVLTPLSLRVVDSDSGLYVSPSFVLYHVNNLSLDVIRRGDFVGTVEVFNESVLNDTYRFRGWVNGTNFSNYYSGEVNCTVWNLSDNCLLQLIKKGMFNVTIVGQGRDYLYLNFTAKGWVRKPTFLMVYNNVFDPEIVGVQRCPVPSGFLYDYDRCYFYDGFLNETILFNVTYLPIGFGRLSFRIMDWDIVNGVDSYSVSDVPDVVLSVNTSSTSVGE